MAIAAPSIEYLLARSFRSPSHRAEAWTALLRTQITVAGKPTADDAVAIGYLAEGGKNLYPLFTSQYIYWGSVAVRPDLGPENLVMPAATLLEMTRGQLMVINPDGPFNIVLEPGDVDRLLSTGTLPADRGRPHLASDEDFEQLFLEHQAAQAASRPEAAVALRKRILETKVFLLTATDPTVSGQIPDGSSVPAVMLKDERGSVCPIFTSMHMVRATLAAGRNLPNRTLVLNGRTALQLTGADRFVLNPHGPAPFFFQY